jgi:peptidoglycan/xylan/chitin deacetylase (PgdA/CDA1 family)
MIEPTASARARAARSFASSVMAAILAVCGIWPTNLLADSPGLPIIVYHQIRNTSDGPADSLEAISLDRFNSEMRYLHEHGYVALSADEVVDYINGGDPLGKKIVAIQFDDGWKSSQLALPVLERYGFTATFWIIAGKGIGWPHMDWDGIEAIARNPRYTIYSHTMTHPWKPGDTMLDWVDRPRTGKGRDEVRWELTESRRVLVEKLGRPVPYLAWPGGHYNDVLIELAKEAGYIALFTIDEGINRPGEDPFRIRRTMVHGGCDTEAFAQILRDGLYRNCTGMVATP